MDNSKNNQSVALVGFIFALLTPTAFGASFHGLGALPDGSFQSEQATDVSADGSAVVGAGLATPLFSQQAFLWTEAGGLVGIGGLPNAPYPTSSAQAVSADGRVAVGNAQNASAAVEAFRWTEAGGMAGLGDLPGGTFSSMAYGASTDGSVVVGNGWSASGREAFRWTEAGGMTGLGDFAGGAFDSTANDVSADGSVVVGYGSSASGVEAFRWTQAGGLAGLGDLAGGGFDSIAYGVSPDGSVVVGRGTSALGREAFRWTEAEGMRGLGILPGGTRSVASDVSADGTVVVGASVTGSEADAFLWTEASGMQALGAILSSGFGLDLGGWRLGSASGISDDGLTIAGWGLHDGAREAWVATLGPPGSTPLDPLLPIVAETGWRFELTIDDINRRVYVDPRVAVGYEYQIDAGPNFQSVLLPNVGDGLYDLFLFDGGLNDWVFESVVAQGSVFDFGPGGVSRFRVTGIEASAGLDPNDVTAFVTGLTFAGGGTVLMRQLPLTEETGPAQSVPELDAAAGTGAFGLLIGGLALLGERGRKNRARAG